jgi:hypothetical protein
MGWLRAIWNKVVVVAEKFEQRRDRRAKDRGTFTQGSEQMVDSDMAREMGRSTSNRRSGFGRGV